MVGSVNISSRTRWEGLDQAVRRVFKDYCLRVDPVTNLGLSSDSVLSYSIGDIVRSRDTPPPTLSPDNLITADTPHLSLTLRGTSQNAVDALAFDLLVPKSIVQRYVSLLVEHRRIILCGPSGTGKTYLAHKLAEFLIVRSGSRDSGSIATFNVEHKSSKELRSYLSNVAEQCEHGLMHELPSVIVLDNLHHVSSSLPDVFTGFLNVKYHQCPYIIGTMNQSTCSTTNLQLHHNFRWILCANHMEPVKGFLGRYLTRKLLDEETRRSRGDGGRAGAVGAPGAAGGENTRSEHTGLDNEDRGLLRTIVDWLPQVWLHLNRFLELHASSDMTIGPRLFLSCPMDATHAQTWFTDLWNYSITPYMLEAVRDGIQTFGQRSPWDDPLTWILQSLPWRPSSDSPPLHQLRPEDVGYDMTRQQQLQQQQQPTEPRRDPLMSMFLRLQESSCDDERITTDTV